MDDLIKSYGQWRKRLVFITDGGTWIKNWIEYAFPQAISILDFYHVCEHLHLFANVAFSDDVERKKWTDKQKALLLQSKVTMVIKNIIRLINKCKKA